MEAMSVVFDMFGCFLLFQTSEAEACWWVYRELCKFLRGEIAAVAGVSLDLTV